MLQLKRQTWNWNVANNLVLLIFILMTMISIHQVNARPHNNDKQLQQRQRKDITSSLVKSNGNKNPIGTANVAAPSAATINRKTRGINCKDRRNRHNRRCIGKRGVLFPGDDYPDYDYDTNFGLNRVRGGSDYPVYPNIGNNDDSDDIRPENIFAQFNQKQKNGEKLINATISKCQQSGATYCEDEYPAEYAQHVENLIHKDGTAYEKLFAAVQPLATSDKDDLDVEQRFGGSSFTYEISMCSIRKSTIYPKVAMATDHSWSTIVNQQNYIQPVHVELCEDTVLSDSGHHLIEKILPNGYTAKCKQKFQNSPLVSLENDNMKMKYFQLPSHCELVLIRKL